ncbi:MAG: amidohydrolase family protein [Gammaproteobacteria bacterium]
MIVDCDCHNFWSSSDVLLPYLRGWWKDCFLRGERTGTRGSFPHGHRAWMHPEDFKRADINPQGEDGHYELMRDRHLDPNGIGAAVLIGDEPLEVSTLGNGHYAAALAAAHNDWLAERWLARDSRLYGSVIIAPQDPPAAAAEIRRLGKNPRFVQAVASSCSTLPYGDPFYHPIYEACADTGMPFAIHVGGNGGINTAPHANGAPRYFIEHHVLQCQPAQTHMLSMIMNGVFGKFPGLKFIIVECGIAWMAPLLWRLDADWKALRKETPWVKKPPSEYFREHIRATTQPLEQPSDINHLWACLEGMDGRRTLMFASDYPHWDQDDISAVQFPEGWRDDVMGGNALAVYDRISATPSAG